FRHLKPGGIDYYQGATDVTAGHAGNSPFCVDVPFNAMAWISSPAPTPPPTSPVPYTGTLIDMIYLQISGGGNSAVLTKIEFGDQPMSSAGQCYVAVLPRV